MERFRRRMAIISFLILMVAGVVLAARRQNVDFSKLPWDPPSTFSILGYDPDTGEVGAAVQSRVFSVGNGVLWGEAGVGVAGTQAIVDVNYGPQAIQLLRLGYPPEKIVNFILDADPDPRPQDWSKGG